MRRERVYSGGADWVGRRFPEFRARSCQKGLWQAVDRRRNAVATLARGIAERIVFERACRPSENSAVSRILRSGLNLQGRSLVRILSPSARENDHEPTLTRNEN